MGMSRKSAPWFLQEWPIRCDGVQQRQPGARGEPFHEVGRRGDLVFSGPIETATRHHLHHQGCMRGVREAVPPPVPYQPGRGPRHQQPQLHAHRGRGRPLARCEVSFICTSIAWKSVAYTAEKVSTGPTCTLFGSDRTTVCRACGGREELW